MYTGAQEKLLAATAELIYERGVTAAGVDAIAERAGVTKRTLYQRFGSKDALVAAALLARGEPVMAGLRAAVDRRAARDVSVPVLAVFDVLDRLFRRPGWQGCAFQRATLELTDPAHPAHEPAQAHLAARRALVEELCAASGAPELADEVALLVEGAMALSGAGDAGAALRARAVVAARL